MANRTQYMRDYYIRTADERKDRAKKWKADNPERVRIYQNKRNRSEAGKAASMRARLRKYGLTLSDYETLLKSQNGCCAACGKDKNTQRDWHVDHCHATGKVRGLLCQRCNLAIGYAKDDPARLRAMAEYLERT